ncbi:hypothetical protein RHMOL_Rhmol05G0060300 [Rhododendron molle]|uniref:Uncharacterized protein n=1 Tax=Rhododendron molle TaxID=49168 RepID=A0ACC0NN95_RHOML|nr:hypothetical protein RHMOL_Rhmol05G0060300 [Rhododendron molle]
MLPHQEEKEEFLLPYQKKEEFLEEEEFLLPHQEEEKEFLLPYQEEEKFLEEEEFLLPDQEEEEEEEEEFLLPYHEEEFLLPHQEESKCQEGKKGSYLADFEQSQPSMRPLLSLPALNDLTTFMLRMRSCAFDLVLSSSIHGILTGQVVEGASMNAASYLPIIISFVVIAFWPFKQAPMDAHLGAKVPVGA